MNLNNINAHARYIQVHLNCTAIVPNTSKNFSDLKCVAESLDVKPVAHIERMIMVEVVL